MVSRQAAAAGVAVVLVGLVMPAIAVAAPGAEARAAQAAAVDLPEATEVEKAKALAAIGIVADGEWIILPDRSFVSRLLTDAKSAPLIEVRAAARAALDVEGTDAATLFIRSEIFVAVEKDESRIRQEQLAKQQAREAKQRALAYLELPATPERLDLPDDQFIRRIGALVTWDWGTRVQAGVDAALRGEAPQWKAFIEAGVIAAHQADVEAYIQAQHDKTEAEKEALRQKDIKRRAASVVAWAPTEGELTLANDNFIRKVEEKAVAGTEVAVAALAALRSPEPTVWAAFLSTGIYAASERDKQIAVDKKTAADRKLALEIQTKATNSLMHPALAAAAATALAGTPADVDRFLLTGQYEALTQSLGNTLRGRSLHYAQTAGGNATLAPKPDAIGAVGTPVADVTWKVVEGLADQACFSLESAAHPGHYLRNNALRAQLQPSDGSDVFKKSATWCARPGKTGQGVSLEVFDAPGRFLRHLNGELFAATNTRANWFDSPTLFNESASWQVSEPNPKLTRVDVRWLNGASGQCLAQDGTAVVATACVGTNGQSWYRDTLANGDLKFVNVASGACLDQTYTGGVPGRPILAGPCHDGANQVWYETKLADGSYTVRNRASGQCLDQDYNDGTAHRPVNAIPCNTQANKSWFRDAVLRGTGKLLNGASGECLDQDHSNGAPHLPVLAYLCHAGTNQQWQREYAANGDIRFVNVSSGQCLDQDHNDGLPHPPVNAIPCHGAANQAWYLTPVANGTFRLRNRSSGQCLDQDYSGGTPHRPVNAIPCNGQANQTWR
jgi:hypothetical protein